MKKLMVTAAAALTATIGFSVESQNIVGYATDTVAQGKFVIKSLGFEGVADASTDVNDILKGFTGVDYDDEFNFQKTAPQIQVLSSTGGYTIYYYLNDGYVDDETYVEGWCDSAGTLVNDATIGVGAGFWIKSPAAMTATFNK